MDTKEAFGCPRISERTRFHDVEVIEIGKKCGGDELNMLDELWVQEGEAGKLILKEKLCN